MLPAQQLQLRLNLKWDAWKLQVPNAKTDVHDFSFVRKYSAYYNSVPDYTIHYKHWKSYKQITQLAKMQMLLVQYFENNSHLHAQCWLHSWRMPAGRWIENLSWNTGLAIHLGSKCYHQDHAEKCSFCKCHASAMMLHWTLNKMTQVRIKLHEQQIFFYCCVVKANVWYC